MQLRNTLLLFLVLLTAGMTAQVVRQVSFADVSAPGALTLDQLIDADLEAANGETHYIYELERERPFLFSGQLRYDSTFHVEIRAQAGDGARPIILQGIGDGGEVEDQLIRINGTAQITLRDIILTGRSDQGGYNNRLVRFDGANRGVIDNCHFDEAGQAHFRLSGGDMKLYITNSVFNRGGRPSNPDNGRLIDNRGDELDSLVVRNCQIVNTTSRIFRNGGSATANYVEFDRNVMINTGQHGFAFLSINTLRFTNNIMVNPIMFGWDSLAQSFQHPDSSRYVIQVDTFVNGVNDYVVQHNNFFTTEGVEAAIAAAGGDSLVSPSEFNTYVSPYIIEAMDSAGIMGNNISEILEFENGPITPSQFIEAVIRDTTSGNEVPAAMPWDLSNLSPVELYSGMNLGSMENIDRYDEFYNLCYGSDAQSATAATDGASLGGLTDCAALSTDNLASAWALNMFPNPTGGRLTVTLNDATRDMTAIVFDYLGRQVSPAVVFRGQTDLDLTELPSGAYYVRVHSAGGGIAVNKVIKN